ncbi:ribonuclease HII [Rossellomorea aquimaris]|uniref:ribonuclease HII n=1 Tax=Rossellomorea aquimaris TaxID=189382 RepID=UPI001CD6E0D2|nr:ribonuclease HII [Rossellomorea aquimaris]MCA1053494.1 ribonuclease HII [Rossellomorea aquimaris]
MNNMTVKEIKTLVEQLEEEDPIFEQLQKDKRKGVQKAINDFYRKQQRLIKEREDFEKLTAFEKKLYGEGFSLIAGIDEVGRGPLAGPVVAAAVILPQDFYLAGLNDSKKLSQSKREEYFDVIMKEAHSVGIGMIEADVIDSINIYEATKKAMLQAILDLGCNPHYLLIDAMKLQTPYPQESIIKGDAKSISIAAASIVAKVTRDKLMKEYEVTYPGYGFGQNAGYGTREHLEGLQEKGVTPIHRRSFAPIKDYERK